MIFNPVDAMQGTTLMMDLIAKKQKALGENLANVDTPGYTRRDVQFGQYLGTSVSPLENKVIAKYGSAPVFENNSQEPVNVGNELLELQKNSLLYSMATRRMSNIITEMKTVINVGK
ncbi:MAG: flagellar basal body protein [Candidatus Gastranaerophilales bacterium]|nr:flagellar basal body protein [Candidatus Gastranaerophilales bacterium]